MEKIEAYDKMKKSSKELGQLLCFMLRAESDLVVN
jgi:hypothetical protein